MVRRGRAAQLRPGDEESSGPDEEPSASFALSLIALPVTSPVPSVGHEHLKIHSQHVLIGSVFSG